MTMAIYETVVEENNWVMERHGTKNSCNQHDDTQPNGTRLKVLIVILYVVTKPIMLCHNAECHNEGHYAECHGAKCQNLHVVTEAKARNVKNLSEW